MSSISEGTVVLIEKGGIHKPFVLRKSKKVSLARLGSFYPDGAFGHPYGSSFEVVKNQLVVKKKTSLDLRAVESQSDNRGVFDDGKAQILSHLDIAEMRDSGCTGEGIVESMVEHSKSFKEKTKFSQEKYVKKKEDKHVPVIRIIRPSTRLLCDLYYLRGSSNMYHLRPDAVAQILTHANIHSHTDVLVMETCQSLLVGAILERMGGFGRLVQVFFGDFPVRLALDNFGHLTDTDRAILMEYPLQKIKCLRSSKQSSESGQTGSVARGKDISVETDSSTAEDQGKDSNAIENSIPPSKVAKIEERSTSEEVSQNECCEPKEVLESCRMDALVIASRFHPTSLLMTLIHFVAPSRPFVVYCHLLDPLVECYRHLKEAGLSYNIQISDTWTRHYQVLPERTHPEVNMDAQSGYLLIGTTVHAETTL